MNRDDMTIFTWRLSLLVENLNYKDQLKKLLIQLNFSKK